MRVFPHHRCAQPGTAMKIDWFVKILLALIAVSLVAIALRP
jgi:hypothetical protein